MSLFTIDGILAALQGGNGEMAKRFLESQGVTRGAGDAIDQLAERIVRYLDEGKLTREAVVQLHRELLESGNKRVYVFRGDPTKMRRRRKGEFGGVAIDSLNDARVRRTPVSPHMNYAFVSDNQLRFSFSETHTHWRPVVATRAWEQRVETNVVVIDADTSSGVVTIAFDSPGNEHSHGSTATLYYNHYIEIEAPALLGTDLVALEWYDAMHHVEDKCYSALVRSGAVGGVGKCGSVMRFVPPGTADLRDSTSYQHATKDIALRKSARLIWNATRPRPEDLERVRAGEALLRDVKTEVYASPAMIRFSKHTLSHEMTYVIRAIRSIS